MKIIDRAELIRRAEKIIEKGVLVHDKYRLDIRGELICGENVEIDINVIIEGNVRIGNNVKVGANCILKNCSLGDDLTVKPFSIISGAKVGNSSMVGPFSRLRPGTHISDKVQIGNYVEIKNSVINAKTRINHMSFIGDANVDGNVTIGAGTITCNHDGIRTQRTFIQSDSYIGSNVNLIAPVKIKTGTVVGAGSTITDDTEENSLYIVRNRQKKIK